MRYRVAYQLVDHQDHVIYVLRRGLRERTTDYAASSALRCVKPTEV
ncbi:hypothetical protein [Streptomyces sp. Wb2n-11]|nr:hypothetical protein [Streptomyces sp. Wb2n-11]